MNKLLVVPLLLICLAGPTRSSEIGTFLEDLIEAVCDSCDCCDWFDRYLP
jgi:hypothetical protein